MKKRIAILIGFSLIYLLAACGRGNTPPPTAAPAAAPTSTPMPKLAAEPASGPAQWLLTITGDPNPLANPNDLKVDPQGNLYVIDSLNNRIQKFDSKGQFLTMWGTQGSDDGEFAFVIPDVGGGVGALGVDEAGNVYVVDWGNSRIQKFDSNGQFLTKWGSRGNGDGQFLNLVSVATDKEGHVYVLDSVRSDIQKFDSNGQFLAKWGGKGSGDGQFIFPASLVVDGQGHVFVVDGFNNRLQKFDSNGQFLAKWGSGGQDEGEFNFISAEIGVGIGGVAIDEQGNVYVADYGNNRVQKFDNNGKFLAKWGAQGISNDQFNHPVALAVDGESNVYIADWGNNRILKFRQL